MRCVLRVMGVNRGGFLRRKRLSWITKSPRSLLQGCRAEALRVGGDLARLLQAYEFILSGHEDLSPAAGDGQKSVFLSLSHSQSTSAPNNGGKGKRRLTWLQIRGKKTSTGMVHKQHFQCAFIYPISAKRHYLLVDAEFRGCYLQPGEKETVICSFC